MSELKINGTLNGKDYFEFKGSTKAAIKFMHDRQSTLEAGQREILKEMIDVRKSVSGMQVRVASIGATVAFVVTIVVLLLKSVI